MIRKIVVLSIALARSGNILLVAREIHVTDIKKESKCIILESNRECAKLRCETTN